MHEFHPRTAVSCGVSLQWERACLAADTSRKGDAVLHSCHGYASMHGHNDGVRQGLCHTSRSVWLLALRVPHRTYHPSAWDSRDENTVVLVFLALHFSPPAEHLAQLVLDDVPDLFQVADLAVAHLNHSFPGIRKALQDFSHKASVVFSFAIIMIPLMGSAK